MHEVAGRDPRIDPTELPSSGKPAWPFFASLGLMGLVWGASYYVADAYRPGEVAAVLAYGGAYFVISHLAILAVWPSPHAAIRLTICGPLACLVTWWLFRLDGWPVGEEVVIWTLFLLGQAGLLAWLARLVTRDGQTVRSRGFRFSLWTLVVIVTGAACGLGMLRFLGSWFGETADWFDMNLYMVLWPVLMLQMIGAAAPLAMLTRTSLSRRLLLWMTGVVSILPGVLFVHWLMKIVEPRLWDSILWLLLAIAGQQAIYLTIALLPIAAVGATKAKQAEEHG